MAEIKSILITGADGQLGRSLREISGNYPQYEFIFTDIGELDITDPAAVENFFADQKPDWVINAAAYTAVDKAECDPEAARKLNSTAVGIIARASASIGAGLVHISTDYVFGGDDPNPLTEEAIVSPRSVYGQTKLEGETQAQQNPRHIIIRTSWLYSAYGHNFVKTMRRLGNERSEVRVVSDQWGCPTSAHDLAAAIMKIIPEPVYGTFHYCGNGVTNWALFAEEIMAISCLDCIVVHIPAEDYPAPAPRPAFSILNTKKIVGTFGLDIPEWEESLEKVIGKLNDPSASK